MLFVLCPAESSSLFGNISWVKAWKLPNKFFINNKIKEVSYKILHRIYAAAKHVLERFKLNISYTFCGQEKKLFHCIYSRLFWKDLELYINRNKWNV